MRPVERQEANGMAHLVNRGWLISRLGLEASKTQLEHLSLQRFGQRHSAHVPTNARQPELATVVLTRANPSGQSTDGFRHLRNLNDLALAADLMLVLA